MKFKKQAILTLGSGHERMMFFSNNFMQSHRYKVSSPRIRVCHSEQLPVKKSSSGHLGQPKSIITRLLFDKKDKKGSASFLQEDRQQVAILRITSRRSSSFEKKQKIILKPISNRRAEKHLSQLLEVKEGRNGNNMRIKGAEPGEGEVEELFYQQVRIQQEFKKLASLIQ